MINLFDLVVWHPCYKSIIAGMLDGSLKNRLNNECCKQKALSIFANGPSIHDTVDYYWKTDEPMDTMMMNDAYLFDLFKEIKPEYYCFADPIDLRPWKEATSYINIISEINPDIVTFVPCWARTDIGYWKTIPIKKVFISDPPLNIKKYSNYLLKKNIMSPPIWNVSIFSLYVAIQLGYKKIYLHGYDMTLYDNIKVDDDNEVIIVNNHYYNEEKSITYLHRSMEYLHEAMFNNSVSFNILAKYAKVQGAEIINMSPISKLDMFSRYKKVY